MKISKPNVGDYPVYFETYISKVLTDDLLADLASNISETLKLIKSLNEAQLNYRYAESKWNIKEILVHVMDAERIFAYRALRFARKDKTDLPGFDENNYTSASQASLRSIGSILEEYESLRKSTIDLFKNFDEEQLTQKGTANKNQVSVNSLGYIIAGHELHHFKVICEKYL